jgi:hypothetical protein
MIGEEFMNFFCAALRNCDARLVCRFHAQIQNVVHERENDGATFDTRQQILLPTMRNHFVAAD